MKKQEKVRMRKGEFEEERGGGGMKIRLEGESARTKMFH